VSGTVLSVVIHEGIWNTDGMTVDRKEAKYLAGVSQCHLAHVDSAEV
jgi:hypothetical protein